MEEYRLEELSIKKINKSINKFRINNVRTNINFKKLSFIGSLKTNHNICKRLDIIQVAATKRVTIGFIRFVTLIVSFLFLKVRA